MRKRRFGMVVALLLAGSMILAGCESNGSDAVDQNANTPSRIVVVSNLATQSMDPYTSQLDNAVSNQLYDMLWQFDEEGNTQPCLAESMEESEDAMSVVVKLREDVTFSDGTEFNADAVVFNFGLAKDSTTEVNVMTGVTDIAKMDEYSVVISKAAPYTDVTKYLAEYMPMVSPTAYQKDPEKFASNPVGTGAFVLEKYDDTTNYVYLKAREDYFQGKPGVDEVEVQVPLDSSVALVALENGEVNYVENPMVESDLKIAESEGLVVERSTGWSMRTVMLLGEPYVSDDNLRMAVTYAINKENAVIYGEDDNAKPADQLMAEKMLGEYAGKTDVIQYNKDTAKEYLKKSNYNGEKLQINVTQETAKLATSIQADLKDIGVASQINQLDENTYAELWENGSVQITIAESGMVSMTPEDMLSYYCNGGYYESVGLVKSTKEMDSLFQVISKTADKTTREEKMTKLLELYQTNSGMVPLYEPTLSFVHTKDLQGTESVWAATLHMYFWKCSFK